MKAWLEQQQPSYVAKTAFGKLPDPGNPEPPEDDRDLKNFVDSLLTAFKIQFSDDLQTGELSEASVLYKVSPTPLHCSFQRPDS